MHTKELPKPGQRIECVSMANDPDAITPGSRGTVLRVQNIPCFNDDHIDVAWDDGRTLCLIASIDEWKVVSKG